MSETKPTAGAEEAAREIWRKQHPNLPCVNATTVQKYARIIDRETNLAQLKADSKKLREPATCNAGHKSNLPLALWDCPVCTQLLRDQLQQVKEKAGELVEEIIATHKGWGHLGWKAPPAMRKILAKAHEVEAALGGKAETPDIDLEAHERDLERRSGCEFE